MRVLHVIPSVSLAHGGPSQVIQEMERVLAERGIQVTTVTTNDDGVGRRLSPPYGIAVETEFATRWYFQLDAEHYKISTALGGWLRKNIKSFDLVHAHAMFSFAPIAAAYIARKQSVPYVIRPLGVLGRYGMSTRRSWLKKVSLALIEGPLIESAAAVQFTSFSEKAEAEALGLKCRGVVVPLGIESRQAGDFEPKAIPKPGQPIRLLYLSRIDRKKNLENLLQALSLALMTRENLVLSIAGDGDPAYINRLKELAARLGLADKVEWLGFVGGEKKRNLFASATAFVLSSYSENFGVAVLEALTACLPCVVSKEVALSEEIGLSKAGVVTGTDAASIASGLLQVVRSTDDYLSMSVAAQGLARGSFSREAMGRGLEALYRGIIKPSENSR